VKNGALSKNYVNYSSITRCLNVNSNSHDALYLSNGKICCPSVNSSINKCRLYSGIRCLSFVDSNSVTCSLSYSSFVDNIASVSICIRFDRGGSKSEIKYCNILRNTQGPDYDATIKSSGNLMIEDSCILENEAPYIFYAESSYTITLSNCTVDSTSHTNSFIFQNTITKSFVLGLNHMSTQNCNSGYDSIGTLSVIPYASHPTKREFCYTYRIILYQARISILFSLIWVFIVTFIHPNPSG
jgi:hypothetical protein